MQPARTLHDTLSLHDALPICARLDVPVAGRGGVPATGADSVVLNVTATNTTTAGFLTVYASGGPWPGSSNLNWAAGRSEEHTSELKSPYDFVCRILFDKQKIH